MPTSDDELGAAFVNGGRTSVTLIKPDEVQKPRLAFVAAVPETVDAFLLGFCSDLSDIFEIDVIADYSVEHISITDLQSRSISVPISRSIRPIRDLVALFQLYKVFRSNKYECVVSITPKAGLLTMVAAKVAWVPRRVHWFTGQVWATKHGFSRWALRLLDKLTAKCATQILVDSPSQREFIVGENVVNRAEAGVLGDGSVCGVDTEIFKPNPESRARIRDELRIEESAIVVLYVGRINRDKGVLVLAEALSLVSSQNPIVLLIAGLDEDDLTETIRQEMQENAIQIHFLGVTDRPQEAMSAADIFCMPSFREGFGLSTIEASACQLPCVASDVYGLRDAVEDGVTGMLFPAGDIEALSILLESLMENQVERERLGRNGRRRVKERFTQGRLNSCMREFLLTGKSN